MDFEITKNGSSGLTESIFNCLKNKQGVLAIGIEVKDTKIMIKPWEPNFQPQNSKVSIGEVKMRKSKGGG